MIMYGSVRGRQYRNKQPGYKAQLNARRCNKCGETKPFDQFYFYRSTDGRTRLRSVCKECDKARHRRQS